MFNKSKPLVSPNQLFDSYLELRHSRRKRMERIEELQQSMRAVHTCLMDLKLFRANILTMLHQARTHHLGDIMEGLEYQTTCAYTIYHGLKACDVDLRQQRTMEIKAVEEIDMSLYQLEQDMRAQLIPKKERKKQIKKKKSQVAHAIIKTSLSKCSLLSVNTATSKNSVSLGGALLKKWLTPFIKTL